jgi:hypothetical protein
MELLKLTEAHRKDINDFLMREPHTHLYQMEQLHNSNLDQTDDEWRAIYSDSQLIALSLSVGRWKNGGRSISAAAIGEEEGCFLLGEEEISFGGTELIMGPRSSSDAFFQGMECPEYRRFQDQRLFINQNIPHPYSYLELRQARIDEFELLEVWAGQMLEEDTGTNPRSIDMAIHRSHYLEKIQEGRILVGELTEEACLILKLNYRELMRHFGEIGFVLELGSQMPLGTQVGNTFVPQHLRRHGLGFRGMRGATHKILQKSQIITLLAHEKNLPAVRTHLRAGFKKSTPFRVIELI